MTSRVTRSLFERETRAIEANATDNEFLRCTRPRNPLRFFLAVVLRASRKTERERERERHVLTFFSPFSHVFLAFPL